MSRTQARILKLNNNINGYGLYTLLANRKNYEHTN